MKYTYFDLISDDRRNKIKKMCIQSVDLKT